MKVSYNGFTGELVKLERTFITEPHMLKFARYELTISYLKDGVYSRITFPDVSLEDVKFIGGAVSFGK